MTREERENVLHCLKVMIDEEVCEECNLYGTTGTDHCEADCVRMAIKAIEQEPVIDKIKENIQFIKDKCLPNNIAEEYEQKGLQEALDIIDKYISGKENNDTDR